MSPAKPRSTPPLLAAAAFAIGALLAACGAKPNAKAATGRDTVANGEVAKTPAAPTVTHHGAETFLTVDSVRPHLVAGRNAHDSVSYFSAIRAGSRAAPHWPAWPTPLAGSLLPAHRIVAFYGNPQSQKMGVLGEYPEQQMLSMLDARVAEWKKADPSVPV